MRVLNVLKSITLLAFGLGLSPGISIGADVNRQLSIEADPLAPLAAARENGAGKTTSMWGGGVDFNLGEVSTGPEIWTGTFGRMGRGCDDTYVPLNDLQCGDSLKVDAVRLRWNVGIWESRYTMRGFFVRAGYSYEKVQAKLHRNYAANLVGKFGISEAETSSEIVDLRQGIAATAGQRWTFWDNKGTATLAISYTQNLKRNVDTDGDNPNARDDYDAAIESIQDTRLSMRPMPELNLGVGYLW